MKMKPPSGSENTNPIKPNLKNAQAAVAYDRKAEQLFGHFAEVVKAQLRPRLHRVPDLLQLGDRHKIHLGYHLFPLVDLRFVQNPIVDYSEMHTTNLVGVVIEQSNNAVSAAGMVRFYGNFLGYFSLNGDGIHLFIVERRIEQRYFIIDGIYMASYADRPVPDKPPLPGPRTPDIAEVLAVTGHDYVGNDLLERGVNFRLRPGHEARNARSEQLVQIPLHVQCKSLEHPYLLKDFSLDNQYLFFLRHSVLSFHFAQDGEPVEPFRASYLVYRISPIANPSIINSKSSIVNSKWDKPFAL